MQKNYFFLKTKPTQNLNDMLQKLHFDGSLSLKSKFIKRILGLALLLLTNFGYSQLAAEYFESGIPGTWAVKSNLATPPINNNWISSAAGTGYGGGTSKAASVNPALNVTTGTTAQYFMITPLFNTPSNGEIRFYTKQGSFTNKGTTYQVRISTASQPDISSFNVVLGSWTEAQLNVSATTYEEKIVSIPSSIQSGIPVYIAFVAITNQTGTTATSGDTWFVDNVRVIPGCSPVTGITSTVGSDSAVINWTHPFATEFGIEVVPSGAGHGSVGTPVTGTTYNAIGLNPLTTYDVYIIVNCDGTTSSTWAGPFSFTTASIGLTCPTAIQVPSDVTVTPYIYSNNLDQFYDADTYVSYNSQDLACQPTGTPSTWNLLLGNHAYFSFTPSTTGLVNISQTINSLAGGAGNCYNASSSIFIFNACAGVGTSAGCLGGARTDTNMLTAAFNNFYVQAGQTYIILISSPYQHSNPGAGICFTLTISGSTCPAPAMITYENLQQTSITASWNNAQNLVSAWEYIALPVTSGAPTASQTGTTPTNSNTNNPVSGLLPGTDYNLYVRSVCGGTPGPWSAPMPFTTQCNVLPLPFYTGFTNASATSPEPCWTVLNLNNDPYKFSFGNNAFSEPVAKLRTADNDPNDMLMTPQFHFDGVTQKRLRFKYNIYGNWGLIVDNPPGGPGSFEVLLSTSGVGENDFTTVLVPLTSYVTQYHFIEMIVPIPANIVGDVNIAWKLPPGALQTGMWIYIDDVYVEDMPACSEPLYPTITPGSITNTSVNVSWTNGYNNTQWQIVAQPEGTGTPTTGLLVNTNPYTITNLIPGTRYEIYVRAYCNATEQSIWAGPIYFHTLCDPQPVPYYESLNDSDPNTKKFCWSKRNIGDDNTEWFINENDATISQAPSFFTPFGGFDDWLVSGPVNAVGLKRLRYNYRAVAGIFAPAPRGNFEVLMSTTPDFSTYTTIIPSHDFTNSSYEERTTLFTGTGVVYIAFRVPPTMDNPANSGIMFINDITIDDAPACPFPTGLTITNSTATSATLAWSPGYVETAWEVAVQSPGAGVPTINGATAQTTPTYTANGLTPNSAYEYYVRAVCDANTKSEWRGPFLFRSDCVVYPSPFIETFEPTSPTKSCWKITDGNANGDTWQLNSTVNPIAGEMMAAMFTGNNGNNNDWLVSPTITVHPNQRLRYSYKVYDSFFEEDLKVMLSTTGSATTQFSNILYENSLSADTDANGVVAGSNTVTLASAADVRVGDFIYIADFPFPYPTYVAAVQGTLITMTNSATITQTGVQNIQFEHEVINNEEVREKIINLTNITAPTDINIGFYVPYFPPNPWNYRSQFTFIDNFIIEDIPACPNVINVASSNILDVSAQINWDVAGTETSWEISVQPFGTPAPVGNTLPAYLHTANTHPYNLTGLTPSTLYQYYVRAVCSGTSQSEWVGPFEILTKCDYANVCQYTISLTSGSTGQVARQIDVMQNGGVVQSLEFPGFNDPATIDYQVFLCSGVEFSLYWLGLGSGVQYSQAQIVVRNEANNVIWTSPLGLGTVNTTLYSGVATCGAMTCPQPTNLAVNNQGTFSWTPGGTETQWEVFVQPYQNGTIPQSGTIVNSPSYTPVATDFFDPTAGTYEFLVRAVCGSSNKSYWSGPQEFIRNDEPLNAIHLQVNNNETCNTYGANASFIGATASSVPTTCDGVNGGDVWFDFVATSKVHYIEIKDLAPGSYYTSSYEGNFPRIMISVYHQMPDNSLVELGCSDNNSFTAIYSTELVVGETYKIRLKLNSNIINLKTFSVCVTTPNDMCDINAFNYDFEKPPMQGVTGVSTIITSVVVPGWRTNTDWGTIFFQEGLNIIGSYGPYSGGQNIQITADGVANWNPNDPNIKGLYKDFDTSELTEVDYSFASGTRNNSSTLQLYAGPPSGPFTLVTQNYSSTTDWQHVTGTYAVPSGQTKTRFIFRPEGNAIGHLMDAANFKAPVNIITQGFTMDCNETTVSLDARGVGHWEADVNNPSLVTINTPNNTSTNISGISTPGNYIFHWKTRYCDRTITIIKPGIAEVAQVTNLIEYCKNDTATVLSATVSSGYTLNWYTQAIGGIGTTIVPIPTTSTVGNGQVYYVCATNSSGCEGPRSQIVVQVNALPVITGTLSSCVGGSTQLTGDGTPATTGAWSSSDIGVATVSSTGLVTGLSVGAAIITYINDKGCQTTVTVTISPTASISGTLLACVGTTTQLTGDGTPATTGAWSSSNTGVATVSSAGLVTGLTAGTTIITYTNSSGCQQTATITINGLPIITGATSVCVGLTTQLTGDGTPATTGAWSSSNTTVGTVSNLGLVSGVAAGSTTITYTNSNGCFTTVLVNVTSQITPTFLPIIACQNTLVSFPVQSQEGVTGTWSATTINTATVGVTTYTFTPNTSIPSQGCAVQGTLSVTINALPVISGTLSACIGNTTQLTGDGTPATTGAWSSSNAGVATVSSTGLVTSVAAGTTTITYANSNGCQTTATVAINALPLITGTLSACVGGVTQLTGDGIPAAIGAWSSSNTGVATVSATGLVNGVSLGTSIITYTNSNGCQTTVTVTINALSVITGTTSACVGSTTQLTGDGTPATTGAWSSSDIGIATISATGLVTGVSEGTSTITYTNSNGCQVTAIVTINGLPTITGTLSACVGNTTQLTGSAIAATTNAWTSSNTAVATISATGLVTGVSAGTSTITYANSNGCQVTATVTINGLPTITGTLSACVGNTTQLTGSATAATTNAWISSNTSVATVSTTGLVTGVSEGTSTITYTNSDGCQVTATVTINGLPTMTGTLSVCVGNTTQLSGSATAAATNAWTSSNNAVATISNTGLVTGVSEGTTTITYTNSNGCQVTATVTINGLPTITGTLSACVGNTTQLTGSATAATTNAWTSSNTSVATISATGLVTGVSVGTSTITYTNSNGCQITTIVTVSSQITTSFLPVVVCQNTTVTLPTQSQEGITGTWLPNTIDTATVGTTNYAFTPDTSIPSQSCAVAGSLSVTINGLPTITGTLSACVGNTTQLTGSATAAATNAWVSSNTAVATVSTTGLVTGVSEGTSTITYTNSNGCQVTAIITINGLPNITGTLSACLGNTTQLTGSGTAATTNAWTSSNTAVATVSTTGLVTGVSEGTSTITYTNSNGCQVTATVTINGLPTFTGTLSTCAGNTTQLTGSATAATTNAWVSSNTAVATVSTTGLVAGISAGTSTITYTNNNGCQVTATVTINGLPTITGTLSACIGTTTQLTGSGTAATTNAWSSSNTAVATISTTGLVSTVSAGTTIITYTNSNGCQTTATVTVNALATPNVTFSYAQACINASVNPLPVLPTNFTSGGVFSSTTLTVNATTGAVNLASATVGSHQVIYTLSQNLGTCTAAGTYTATIVISAGITPVTSFTYQSTYCANSVNELPTTTSGFYTGGVFSSTAGLVINVSTGEINFIQSTSGSYTITYTVQPNASNCNTGGTSTFPIVIAPELDYTIEDICQAQMLELHVTPSSGSFTGVNYVWKNQSNTVGTNSPIFNVDQFMTLNPSLSLPQTFTVSVALNGCTYTSSFTVQNNPCRLIPRGISPNNDQVNDTFDLTGLGVTELNIFNRYGAKVYTFSGNYTNQWYGLTDGGNELPDGTYFYSILKGDGSSVTGWVYINRQY